MPGARLLLEFEVVTLNAHHSFVMSTRPSGDVSSGMVESRYFSGSSSPSGHSTGTHPAGRGVLRMGGLEDDVAVRRAHSDRSEPGDEGRIACLHRDNHPAAAVCDVGS